MPRPTFHNLPDEKRQRIIDAAIDEFSSQPYAKATLDRIVAAAGISKGSMYQYFEGKADLYGWLLTSYMGQLKLQAIAADAPPPGSAIWTILEHAFLSGVRFAASHPRLTRLGVRFLRDHELEPALAAISDANRAAADAWLSQLLQSAVEAGEIRADVDLAVASGFLQHALGEGMLDQMARRLGVPLSEYLDHPELTEKLTDDDLVSLVRSVTTLFRLGAGATTPKEDR